MKEHEEIHYKILFVFSITMHFQTDSTIQKTT